QHGGAVAPVVGVRARDRFGTGADAAAQMGETEVAVRNVDRCVEVEALAVERLVEVRGTAGAVHGGDAGAPRGGDVGIVVVTDVHDRRRVAARFCDHEVVQPAALVPAVV